MILVIRQYRLNRTVIFPTGHRGSPCGSDCCGAELQFGLDALALRVRGDHEFGGEIKLTPSPGPVEKQ